MGPAMSAAPVFGESMHSGHACERETPAPIVVHTTTVTNVTTVPTVLPMQ